MARDPKYDILFEPIQIGPKTLQEPLLPGARTATAPARRSPACRPYTAAMKAEGGWGAVCTEYCSIHPESDDIAPRLGAGIWDDGDVRNLARDGRRASTSTARSPASSSGTAARMRRAWRRRATRAGASQIPRDFEHLDICRATWTRTTSATSSGCTSTRRMRARDGRLRHRLRLRRRTRTFRSSSSRRSTTAAPTSTAARSRTAPASGSRRSSRSARPSATTARSPRASRSTRSSSARRSGIQRRRGRRAVRRAARRPRRLLGRQRRRHRRVGRGRRPVAVLRREPRGAVHAHVKAGHRTSRCVGVGRFTNPDTMVDVDQLGPVRHHRRRPAVDRRSVPAAEDRGGPARRDPRVHRLQRLHLALGDRRAADRLHAEPDRRRGVPPRLAPGALRDARRTRERACWSSAPARPAWSARWCSASAACAAVHLVEADSEIGGCVNWISSSATPTARRTCSAEPLAAWASGSGSSTTARSSSTSSRTSRCILVTRLSTEDVLDYGAEIVVVATGCHFATDGLNGATHDADPRGGHVARLAAHTGPGGRRGEADRQAGARARERGLLHGRLDRPEAGRRRPRGDPRHPGGRDRRLHALHARGADASPRPRPARRRHPHLHHAREDRAGDMPCLRRVESRA